MDLRSGCVYWTQKQGDRPPHAARLDRDINTDVAILGAGITGAMSAHYLSQSNIDAILLDRRDIARGSTAASTGLLQYEIDKPLVELADLVGKQTAARAYQLGKEALDEFARLTELLGDDCGFERKKSLFLAASGKDAEIFPRECDARRAIGLHVDYLPESELAARFSFTRPAALLSHDAAQIDPVRFTSALIRRAVNKGLRAFGHTQIDRYESDVHGVTLTTVTGHRIRAKHVIFATGYETPEFLKDIPVKLKSTYAFATGPVTGFSGWGEDGCLIWETGTPYFYLRTEGHDRVIGGGEDDHFADPAARDERIQLKTTILSNKLSTLFPKLKFQIDCAWAGTFAETPDSLPYIGPHECFPHGLFALGYGGNGITFGLIAAQLLRDQILGQPTPDAELFRFDRPGAREVRP